MTIQKYYLTNDLDIDIIVVRLGEEVVKAKVFHVRSHRNFSNDPDPIRYDAILGEKSVENRFNFENKIEEWFIHIAKVDNLLCFNLSQRKAVISCFLLQHECICLDIVQGSTLYVFVLTGQVANDLHDCTSQIIHYLPIFSICRNKRIRRNVPDLSWEIQIPSVRAVVDNPLELNHECVYATLSLIFFDIDPSATNPGCSFISRSESASRLLTWSWGLSTASLLLAPQCLDIYSKYSR